MTDPVPRTACAPTCEEVLRVLRAGRYRLSSEYAAQADIARDFLAAFGVDGYLRERALDRGSRPDFRVGGIVVEVKHRIARPAAILDQLERYSTFDAVTAVILATGRTIGAPPSLNGKPLHQVNLGEAWL